MATTTQEGGYGTEQVQKTTGTVNRSGVHFSKHH